MSAYHITDWEKHYDPPEAQFHKDLTWIRFPNRFDTLTFRKLATEKDAPDLFTAWVLIVQIASKTKYRGCLVRHDDPIEAGDMALMTGFPEQIFKKALKYFSDPKIGWIEAMKIMNVEDHRGEKDVFLMGDTLKMETIQNTYPKRISTMETLVAISSAAEREADRSGNGVAEALKVIAAAVAEYVEHTSSWSPADRRYKIPSPVTWFTEDQWMHKDSWQTNAKKKNTNRKPKPRDLEV